MRRVARIAVASSLMAASLAASACNSNIEIELQGLEPLRVLAPGSLSPLGTGVLEAAGGTRPYRFAFAENGPRTGEGASVDERRGSFRLGRIGRTVERYVVIDARGESQTVEVQVGEALAVDPTRSVVDPGGLADLDAVGGAPPYRFRLEGITEDRIDELTGIFVASGRGGRLVSVEVTDSNGASAYAELAIPLTFGAGNVPVDVVSLDIDRDGDLDVAVASSADATLVLLENVAKDRLALKTILPTGGLPQALEALDVDRDGLVDLIAAVRSPDAVVVYLQDPLSVGGFREVVRHPIASGATDLSAQPLPAGGAFVAATSDTAKSLEVLTLTSVGKGMVSVGASQRIALTAVASRVLVGDFVAGAELDVAVGLTRAAPQKCSVAYYAGDSQSTVSVTPIAEVMLGEGGGVAGTNIGAGQLGGGPRLDIAATSSFSHELGLVIDDPTSGLPTLKRWEIPAGDGAHCAPCGRPDDSACATGALCLQLKATGETRVCASTCESNDDCPHNTECQTASTGDRVCTPARSVCPATSMVATGRNPRDVRIVDFDQDGHPEIALTTVNDNVEVYRRGAQDRWSLAYTAATGRNPLRIDVTDLNADGFPDLVVANRLGHTVTYLPGLGRLFARAGEYDVGPSPADVLVAQLDGDPRGAPDVVVRVGESFLTLAGDGQGGLHPFRRISFGGGSSPPTLYDADRDGDLDLFAFHTLERTFEFVPWEAGVGFTGGPETITGQQPVSLTFSRIDDDDEVDVVVANNLDRNFSIHRGLGSGRYTPYSPQDVVFDYADPAVTTREALAVDDAAGRLSHLFTVARTTSATVLDAVSVPATGQRGTSLWSTSVPGLGSTVARLDCNGDQKQDFAVLFTSVPQNAYDAQVYRATDAAYVVAAELRAGTETSPGVYTNTGAANLVAADFDADGHTDLVIATRITRELVLFKGDGACRFVLSGRVTTGAAVQQIAAGDLDLDGLPDLAVSIPPNEVVVFQNMGTRSGELRSQKPTNGLCEACETDDECGGKSDRCGGQMGRRRFCSRDCSMGKACPSGFTCDPTSQQCLHVGERCVR